MGEFKYIKEPRVVNASNARVVVGDAFVVAYSILPDTSRTQKAGTDEPRL